jgi:hypothetical protein
VAQIVKTNHLPSTNIASGPAAYQGDFSKVAALVMTKQAVGTVKLLDLAVESALRHPPSGHLDRREVRDWSRHPPSRVLVWLN